MTLIKPAMILIDVDGTLVDSVPDLAYCIDEMCMQLGLPARGEAAVRRWVGNGAERLVKRALTNEADGEPDAEMLERAMALFQSLYAENTCERSRLYPGVREALANLETDGYRLGSVTNKPAAFTEPLLEALGIRRYFEIVVSGDSLPRQKPDPQPLLHAARALGANAHESLMVGDSRSDVQAARAAGFQVVCVSYGYNHGEEIVEARPDRVIDSLLELRDLFEAAA